MPQVRLGDLAQRLELEIQGDAETLIDGVCALSPGRPGCIAYCGDDRHREALRATAASAVIVKPGTLAPGPGLLASHPQLAFARVAAIFEPDDGPRPGVASSAVVDPTARLGQGVAVGENAVIGPDVVIGDRTRIGPGTVVERDARIGADGSIAANVVIGARVQIGERALILPGAIIGARGFGNVHDGQRWHTMPQLGSVRVGDDVEIGANTSVDRGALDDTVIEDNVRIDNLCQIAHNVVIGAHTALAAQVGIAGSTRIGRHCLLGGQVGVNGHIEICDGVIVNGGGSVLQSITEPGQYGGTMPIMPAGRWRRLTVVLNKLEGRLKALERKGKT